MFDSPHPPAFFEPLIDSEHAAALIQVHPKPCNVMREKVSSQACVSANFGDSALPNLWLAALKSITRPSTRTLRHSRLE